MDRTAENVAESVMAGYCQRDSKPRVFPGAHAGLPDSARVLVWDEVPTLYGWALLWSATDSGQWCAKEYGIRYEPIDKCTLAIHPVEEDASEAAPEPTREQEHGPEPVLAWVCDECPDIHTGDADQLAHDIEYAHYHGYGSPVSVYAVQKQRLVEVKLVATDRASEGDWRSTTYEVVLPDGTALAELATSISTLA